MCWQPDTSAGRLRMLHTAHTCRQCKVPCPLTCMQGREFVDELFNCEDLLLNYVMAHHLKGGNTGGAAVWCDEGSLGPAQHSSTAGLHSVTTSCLSSLPPFCSHNMMFAYCAGKQNVEWVRPTKRFDVGKFTSKRLSGVAGTFGNGRHNCTQVLGTSIFMQGRMLLSKALQPALAAHPRVLAPLLAAHLITHVACSYRLISRSPQQLYHAHSILFFYELGRRKVLC